MTPPMLSTSSSAALSSPCQAEIVFQSREGLVIGVGTEACAVVAGDAQIDGGDARRPSRRHRRLLTLAPIKQFTFL